MITEIDDYFTKGCGRCERFATPDCSTRKWETGLNDLRRICRNMGLVEAVKWGHPCYMHAGRNIALLGAFRGDFRMSFMNAALMKDPAGVLEKSGPNARRSDMIRFVDNGQVAKMEHVIRAYLAEAMGYAGTGVKPPKEQRDVELPGELVEAMDADPALAEAFHNLTPGRQRSYVINLDGAKKSATRVARIVKFRDRILAGKGALER
jgi:uncharacterized protein YdeI (YjbR/CyaY-like superfamily)